MALSDDHPIKVTSPEYRPAGQGDFEQWLNKEADLAKVAAAPKLEDNEDTSTVNYGDLYDNPPGRTDGANLNASWGEGPNKNKGKQAPFHNNDATFHRANEERRQVTGRALDSFPAAAAVEQALLAKNLEHAARGEYTSHSVLLHDGVKQAGLSERVKDILDRI